VTWRRVAVVGRGKWKWVLGKGWWVVGEGDAGRAWKGWWEGGEGVSEKRTEAQLVEVVLSLSRVYGLGHVRQHKRMCARKSVNTCNVF
jgi:hypothetical protein